jgi:hypothetical protein
MNLLRVIAERRWVILLALLVSAAVAVPFAVMRPASFTSSGEVFIPASDPVGSEVSKASTLSVKLQAYGGSQITTDVRNALGTQSPGLVSVDVVQQRDPNFYDVRAEARNSTTARAAVAVAAQKLMNKSQTFGESQLATLNSEIRSRLAALEHPLATLLTQRSELQTQVRALAADAKSLELSSPGSSEALAAQQKVTKKRIQLHELGAKIGALETQRKGLMNLMQNARDTALSRIASSTVVSGPSQPVTTLPMRVVSTLALAMLVGLVVSILAVVWMERRRIIPVAGESRVTSLQSGREGLRPAASHRFGE